MNETFEVIGDHDLLKETAFYKWLEAKHNRGEAIHSFVHAIKEYTGLEQPFVGRKDGQHHKYAFQVFWSHMLSARSN